MDDNSDPNIYNKALAARDTLMISLLEEIEIRIGGCAGSSSSER